MAVYNKKWLKKSFHNQVLLCLIFVPSHNLAIITRIISYLLIISKAAHDSWVHDAVEEHREGVDGKAGVVKVALDHVADFLIGQLHGFHSVLKGTDFLLQTEAKNIIFREYSTKKDDLRRIASTKNDTQQTERIYTNAKQKIFIRQNGKRWLLL